MDKATMVTREQALPGREERMPVPRSHAVLGHPMEAPWPAHAAIAVFGLGCFWGAERKFWQLPGVYSTAVGYAGGFTPNPTYDEVCSGMTGHNEVVMVVYNQELTDYWQLLQVFWESHDPTQGMRQGNDIGTQYRSGIYFQDDLQQSVARRSLEEYQRVLTKAGHGKITTEVKKLKRFFYAEEYHQQYLHKNPNGYCGLGGLGIPFE